MVTGESHLERRIGSNTENNKTIAIVPYLTQKNVSELRDNFDKYYKNCITGLLDNNIEIYQDNYVAMNQTVALFSKLVDIKSEERKRSLMHIVGNVQIRNHMNQFAIK